MCGFFHCLLLWFIIFKSNKSKPPRISSFRIFFDICKYNISKLWKMLFELFFSCLPWNTEKGIKFDFGQSSDDFQNDGFRKMDIRVRSGRRRFAESWVRLRANLRTAKSDGFWVALLGGWDWANSTSGFWSRIFLFSRFAALSLLKICFYRF